MLSLAPEAADVPGSQFASVTLTAAAEGIKVLQDD